MHGRACAGRPSRDLISSHTDNQTIAAQDVPIGGAGLSLPGSMAVPRSMVSAPDGYWVHGQQTICPMQGKYDVVAGRMDCCLGWLPSSFLPARFAPEEQCVAVLSLVQLLLVWALPIAMLSRSELRSRAGVDGSAAAAQSDGVLALHSNVHLQLGCRLRAG